MEIKNEKEMEISNILLSLTYLIKSYECRDKGNFLESAYYLEKALELNPNLKLAKFLKAILLMILGDIQRSTKYLEEIAKDSKDPITYTLLGQCYELSGNFDKALECYEKSLGIDEKFALVVFFKSLCVGISDECDKTLTYCDKLIANSPDFVPAYIIKADLLRRLGRYEEALHCLNRALDLKSNDKNAMYLKALILKKMGKYDESLKYYEKLIDELNITCIEVIREGIYLSFLFNKLDQAEKYIEMGLKSIPGDASLWYFKGRLYEKQGKAEEALKYYNKALQIMPNHTKALLAKARVLEKLGRIEESIEYYNIALDK
ncbi:tetratricopeptide repeat protein [Methanocaldococcus fervens]|uniref:TPR repeat-containing protein n=1 Tax=Methanocaldococcus fervens (strain DSM 4213 / JCM 15782 / AG86) TaxID=573064 RepID=C7P803_METFA|nr:tetratricopeptide repeat protein [Methanocaldococcus fervens]ACV24685.1 TPR repeat-containing protein [Methanocaldococcus fervens AG86]